MVSDGGQTLLSLKPEVLPQLLLLQKVLVDGDVAVLEVGQRESLK